MCPRRKEEAASVWEEVARDTGGKPGNCDILEVKRRKCLLEERRMKGVNAAERSSKMQAEAEL